MRKKDRRSHKPILKPPSKLAFINSYRPLLWFFLAVVTAMVAICSSPVIVQATSRLDSAGLALAVSLSEAFIVIFSFVGYSHPEMLPVHRFIAPPVRLHRTHISHLRLDRMSKYGFPCRHGTAPSPKSDTAGRFGTPPSPPSSFYLADLLRNEEEAKHRVSSIPSLITASDIDIYIYEDSTSYEDDPSYNDDDDDGYPSPSTCPDHIINPLNDFPRLDRIDDLARARVFRRSTSSIPSLITVSESDHDSDSDSTSDGDDSAHSDNSEPTSILAMRTITDDDGYPPEPRTRPPGPDDTLPDTLDAVVAWLNAQPSPSTIKRKRSTSSSSRRHRGVPFNGGGGGPWGSSPIDVTTSEEEDENLESFTRAEWIGVGKVWSDKLPRAVKQARNAARHVPSDALAAAIPAGKLTVTALLSQDLPEPSKDLRPAVFTTEAVSAQPSFETAFTSILFLDNLHSSFNNAWLDGATSIRFPHLPYSEFPLWIENFLHHVKRFLSKRRRWEQARKWLDNTSNAVLPDVLSACDDILQILPWDAHVPGLSPSVHLTTQDLALFLSSEWLNDEMINAGVDYILRRLQPGSRVRILNCLFIQSLFNARACSESYTPAAFSPIEKSIRAGNSDIIYFPLHINGNHWTLLKINLLKNTISIADSLGGLPPTAELDLVRWWLASILADAPFFTLVEPDFPSPRQRDGHSCGIVVLSTLASILLDEEIWAPAHAPRHRMDWFLRLTETFADESDSEEYILVDSTDFAPTPETSDYVFSRPNTPSQSSVSWPSSPEIHGIIPDVASVDGLQFEDTDLLLGSPMDAPEVVSVDGLGLMDAPDVASADQLQLEDVDLFLDSPMDVDCSSDFIPDNTTDSMSSFKPSTSEYYASDGEDSDSRESRRLHRRQRTTSRPKTGSSWDFQKRLKSAAKEADFRANKSRLETFRAKILLDDPKAEFDTKDLRRVRCSSCAKYIEMRVLYDLGRWKEHRRTATCTKNRGHGLSTQSLFALGFKKLPRGSSTAMASTPPTRLPLPCPGLARESDEDVAKYLARTAVAGGGAPSRSQIAMELFSERFKDLDPKQHRMVLRRELSLHKWKLARAVGAVFSTTCLREVQTTIGQEPQPCSECQGLYNLHTFKVALHRPMPEEAVMKYVPMGYRDPELGKLFLMHTGLRELVELDDGRSPYLKFAQGCADGTYDSDTLTGMIQALVLKQSRLQRGKSLKNMQYPPEFDQFCNLLASTSPRAYATFQKTFGGRGTRSMREVHAKLPKFGPGISGANVARAADILIKLEYAGPLGLSCDDTALEAAISVYQETKNTCLVLGGVDGAIRVTEDDDLDAVLKAAQLKKADKLRVWLLSIPLPKIPPILIAADARGSSVTSEQLAEKHTQLLNTLHEYGIHPISLATDGAEVERAAQRIIANSTTSHLVYGISNPVPGCDIALKIPLAYGAYPLIITQDSKHALKTARNQIFTGARIIVIGFYAVFFSMLRELAADIAGPLFTRDVEKVDKQDDRAAARMFSANTLEFQLKNYPGQIGLSVYLFLFGELIDAWQNRNICHQDRAKMVLRARFFIMAWRTHILAHPDYSVSTQFISRESYDIFLTICDGLLSLLVAYRKYFPTYPLLPWLHSTEACEHLFGMLRQLKKDFNYADVLYLERKLRALQMGAFGNLSADEQANQVSAGYHHTYFKADDLDTAVLMQYPSDADMVKASEYGFSEAAQLLKLVGINAEAMLRDYKDPVPTNLKPYVSTQSRPPRTFLELLALYETVPLKSLKDERRFESCEMALAAESLDKSLAIDALPDSTEESIEQLRTDIQAHLSVSEPQAPLPSNCELPLVRNKVLNDSVLVSERLRHQTRSTAQAVRQHGRLSTILVNVSNGSFTEKGPSLRQTLMKKIAALVPVSDALNKTTGVDRYVRHAGTFGGAGEPANARTQNKATVQAVAASKFVNLRIQALARHQEIHENMHLANITDFNPLKPGDFVVALKPGGSAPFEVVLGEVITMYTKNTMHDWIPMATSVGTPSYIYVSVHRQIGGPLFTSISCPQLACGTIIQIPRTHLLFSLASFSSKITQQDVPTAEGYPHVLVTLCEMSSALFQKFQKHQHSLSIAIEELVKMAKYKNVDTGPQEPLSFAVLRDTEHIEED